jgi:hypothetical protein
VHNQLHTWPAEEKKEAERATKKPSGAWARQLFSPSWTCKRIYSKRFLTVRHVLRHSPIDIGEQLRRSAKFFHASTSMSTRFLLTFLTVCLLSLLALGTGHCSANDGSSTSLNQFQTRAVATTFCANNPVYYQEYSVAQLSYVNRTRVIITEVVLIQDSQCLCVRNNEFTPQSLQLLSAAYALEPTATKIQDYD